MTKHSTPRRARPVRTRRGGWLILLAALVLTAGSCTPATPAPAMDPIEMPAFVPQDGGAVWVVGDDCHGRLGDGLSTQSENEASCAATIRLAQAAGLDDVVLVRAKGDSVFAVVGDGTLWAWGDNSDGQLGDGTTTDRDEPVQVPGLSQVVDVTLGDDVYAVVADGTVWRWQFDPNGVRRTSATTTPEQIDGITGVASVAEDHNGRLWTLRADGTVMGWNDACGHQNRPITVNGLDDVVQVASWFYGGIALRADGTVWSWSYDCYQSDVVDDATQVPGLTDVAWLEEDAVLKKDGTVWTLSTGFESDPWKLSPVAGLDEVAAVVHIDDYSGTESGYALRRDGSVWSWSDRSSPRRVPGLPAATQIAGTGAAVFVVAGGDAPGPGATPAHTAVPGPVVSWSSDKPTSTTTTGIDQAVSLAAYGGTGFAVLDDGTVHAWGNNRYGLLGDGTADEASHPDPVPITGLSSIVSVTADVTSAYAIDTSGRVWTWGDSLHPSPPKQVSGITGVTKVAGTTIMYALRQDNTVWTWDGRTSPAPVPGLTDVVDISLSGSDMVAVKADGTVWVWGVYARDGVSPVVQVSGMKDATALIGEGDGWWFVARTDGTVWVVRTPWASPASTSVADLFVAQIEGLTDVVKVVGETGSYVALRSDGSLWAFETPGSTFVAPDQTLLNSVHGIHGLGVGPVPALPPVADVMVCRSRVYAITNA